MDYSKAKAGKIVIEMAHDAAAIRLRAISGDKGPMGLTPAHIKTTPEWQDAYKAERRLFAIMREYNRKFNKLYGKEYRDELKAAREAKLKGE